APYREEGLMACSRGEYAMSSRSISSSSWTPTITATGLPFRVTTTGPDSLAFRKALSCDLISATDAIFIPSPSGLSRLGSCQLPPPIATYGKGGGGGDAGG